MSDTVYYAGKDFTAEMEMTSGVWTAIPGERVSSGALQNEIVDTTTKTDLVSSLYKRTNAYGIRSSEIKASGVSADGATKTAYNFLMARAVDGALFSVRLKSNTVQWLQAQCQVVSINRSGDHNKAELYDIVLASSFAVAVGAPAEIALDEDQDSVYTPATVEFTAAITGGTGPFTYDWDFGDGSAHSTSANPTHIYTVVGTYTVTLTVTDANGLVTIATSTVDVIAATGPASMPWNPVLAQDPIPSPRTVGFVTRTNLP